MVIRSALGELADGLLLASQRVQPSRLDDSGFVFEQPDLEGALRHALDGPWELRGSLFGQVDYPERLVDHQEAVAAFREHRR